MKLQKSFIPKLATTIAFTGVLSLVHAQGIPVGDVMTFTQTRISAEQAVEQTQNQISQYQTQLQQYENMLQNTMQPASYVWDQASATISQLRASIDTLNYYKSTLGSLDAYLGKFKDTAGYRNSSCFSASGCSPADLASLQTSQQLGSESQKRATDALFQGLDRQQDAMQTDAYRLQQLQVNAQGATGQLQAIGFANQLASQQANQLLQIRGLLIAQQNAMATRNQALADRESQQAASGYQVRQGTYRPSAVRRW